jgi:hypothetical protein
MLIRVARKAYEAATARRAGWEYDAVVAIVFAALALEALSNAVGERCVPNWPDFDRAGPNAKLQVVATYLDVPYDKDKEPWQTARWLAKFRNQVAHAKPELVQEETILSAEKHEKQLFYQPQAKLEKQITLPNAKRSLAAAEEVKRLFCEKLPPSDSSGITFDDWDGTATLHEDA